ncbi:MAG TPA: T9SS type A sorting domain-containing protein, partial [Ignavibacteria bacterium]|nr:T9SS type A sorting domain-containing protein [Ignavibacteria bacterium]
GNPSQAGIVFESDSYPLFDSGYNVTSVGNSNYIEGYSSESQLMARVNNWNDDPPNSEQFAVGGAGIDYSDPFDGTSLPSTDYYELDSLSFGYFDTVYVDEFGGDSPTAEELFIQAYLKEIEGQYSSAVSKYKDVISTYKTSKYAISSLSRIFNCLEKANSNNSHYNAIKTYYNGLQNSNNYPVQIREIAEDLAIKSKVRMGFLEAAISDYQTIINNNPNTPKGIHAMINKLCLEHMNSGGDNLMKGNNQTNEGYKTSLLSLIIGKKIETGKTITNNIPGQFKLYQNYPNPFNPVTIIKYDIPKDGQVSLKIYDITGREVFSVNEFRQAGSYSVTFNGTNFASGLYLYQLKAGNYVETKKMVLIK